MLVCKGLALMTSLS